MHVHRLVAVNTASGSDNKIHDDEVARRFGFSGGLVPGVDVYAYLTWGPVSVWGLEWLTHGSIDARFRAPTYDGEAVVVEFDDSAEHVQLRNSTDVVVSEAATRRHESWPPPSIDADRYAFTPRPDHRTEASPETLAAGTRLSSVEDVFVAGEATVYLASVRESLAVYARERVAHPGWLARFANAILVANVHLGPWIHVGSRVTNHGLVHDGAFVSCRGVVAAEYERKGHRFVELDVALFADDVAVASIWHTAIYRPRHVTGSDTDTP